MNLIRKDMLWEMARYQPQIIFNLEVVNTRLQQKLTADLSWIHYFCEEIYAAQYIRKKSYKTCKDLIMKIIRPPDNLAFLCQTSGKTYVVDMRTKSRICLKLRYMRQHNVPNWTWLDYSTMFIGGLGKENKGCRILDVKTIRQERRNDMTHGHQFFALTRLAQIWYAFGGASGCLVSEKYSVRQNRWSVISPLPKSNKQYNAVGFAGLIYIAGYGHVFWYNAKEDSYYEMNLSLSTASSKCILTEGHYLYIIFTAKSVTISHHGVIKGETRYMVQKTTDLLGAPARYNKCLYFLRYEDFEGYFVFNTIDKTLRYETLKL